MRHRAGYRFRGTVKKNEGRGKREEGRGKREEGRGKREDRFARKKKNLFLEDRGDRCAGKTLILLVSSLFPAKRSS
jgi:hypothetical protein